ncbi:hypothetical protein JOB18_034459, partial [Solea senegalensis]
VVVFAGSGSRPQRSCYTERHAGALHRCLPATDEQPRYDTLRQLGLSDLKAAQNKRKKKH